MVVLVTSRDEKTHVLYSHNLQEPDFHIKACVYAFFDSEMVIWIFFLLLSLLLHIIMSLSFSASPICMNVVLPLLWLCSLSSSSSLWLRGICMAQDLPI